MTQQRISSVQPFSTNVAAMAVVAATLAFTQFVASPARAMRVGATQNAGANRKLCFSTAPSAVKSLAKSPVMPELTQPTCHLSTLARVHIKASFLQDSIQCDDSASNSFHQFVSIFRDSVDPVAVLPGTPPPAQLS